MSVAGALDLSALAEGTRVYCQPTAMVDRPHGLDGRVARLAGGPIWFSAWRVRARAEGRYLGETTVPVGAMAEAIDRARPAVAAALAAQVANATAPRAPLVLGERVVRLDEPRILGILNATPDSFSDGGQAGASPEEIAATGIGLAAEGAAIIDVGGESTRPGATPVFAGDEAARVVPVIERLARVGTAVSLDTRQAEVMRAGLAAGAHLINDVSGFRHDPDSLAVVAGAGCPVIVMHACGDGRDLHAPMTGDQPLLDVVDWLAARVALLMRHGVPRERILVDPGFGFGKSVADNLAILNGLALLQVLGVGVVAGLSRKRLIGALDDEAPVERRLGGGIALHLAAIERGAQMVRVHDVAAMRQAIRAWRGLRDQALTAP